MTTLHYIFDPLCGWCYAAAPLVAAARAVPGVAVAFHGGGMMTGAQRRTITPQLREYVLPHDRRIAQVSGQPFGRAYFEGLLRDTSAVMDSEPPTTAVLAAEELGARGLDMIHRLQRAHYVEGRRIAEPAVLQQLAEDLGLDGAAFASAFARLAGPATQKHIEASRQWLARAGGHGFPTFVLEQPGGRLDTLDIGPWLGRPEAWATHLAAQVPAGPAVAGSFACGPDGCAL